MKSEQVTRLQHAFHRRHLSSLAAEAIRHLTYLPHSPQWSNLPKTPFTSLHALKSCLLVLPFAVIPHCTSLRHVTQQLEIAQAY